MNCGGCHTTCGQCHVSRPASVGGGFPKTFTYLSHNFQRTPHMTEQCTACHGSRVGTDFQGEIAGNQPDAHYSRGMRCEACHDAEELHGDSQYSGDHYEHRYQVATMPRCEECHDGVANNYHSAHVNGFGPDLQCQVCHSQPYKNCTNCHNLTPATLVEKYDIDPSRAQFKIGHNPLLSTRGEYDYVVLRHVPVDPSTFSSWGLSLPGYLDAPTWKYTSPHNIQRWTPQTTVEPGQSCNASCHGGAGGVYLRESDLYADDGVTPLPDYQANVDLVMPDTQP